MINLLPPEIKENYRYARLNSVLLKWLIGMLGSVVLVCLIIVGGMFVLNHTARGLKVSANNAQNQLNNQKYGQVQNQIKGISSNLKLMVNVLSQEVLFSALLKQVGAAMPQGAILTSLNITQLKGGIDLQAASTNYQTATQIQVNLQDPANKLFSKADIVSIQCGAGKTGFSQTYPCTADVRAQFVANNPDLFINYKGSGGS